VVSGSVTDFITSDLSKHQSINTILILLVLALGKICEWRNPPPAVSDQTIPAERASNLDVLPGLAY